MMNYQWPKSLAWAGLMGGFLSWYGAHELGTYFSAWNCHHHWILPLVHFIAVITCVLSGQVSWKTWLKYGKDLSPDQFYAPFIGVVGSSLFFIVLVWQTIATFIYSGCER
jgi:hypothetical protein